MLVVWLNIVCTLLKRGQLPPPIMNFQLILKYINSLPKGGLKAVLWTDALQLCIMIAGIYVVLIYGTIEQGGFSNVWEANKLSGRLDFME